MERLTDVYGLEISNNAVLTSLSGLERLTSVGALTISDNASLTSLSGLDNLTSIGGGLTIDGNAVLTSLAGLENLSSVGVNVCSVFVDGDGLCGMTIENNASLTSLSGLENLIEVFVWLNIRNNAVLPYCDICTQLAALDPGNTIDACLGNAADGCYVNNILMCN